MKVNEFRGLLEGNNTTIKKVTSTILKIQEFDSKESRDEFISKMLIPANIYKELQDAVNHSLGFEYDTPKDTVKTMIAEEFKFSPSKKISDIIIELNNKISNLIDESEMMSVSIKFKNLVEDNTNYKVFLDDEYFEKLSDLRNSLVDTYNVIVELSE